MVEYKHSDTQVKRFPSISAAMQLRATEIQRTQTRTPSCAGGTGEQSGGLTIKSHDFTVLYCAVYFTALYCTACRTMWCGPPSSFVPQYCCAGRSGLVSIENKFRQFDCEERRAALHCCLPVTAETWNLPPNCWGKLRGFRLCW